MSISNATCNFGSGQIQRKQDMRLSSSSSIDSMQSGGFSNGRSSSNDGENGGNPFSLTQTKRNSLSGPDDLKPTFSFQEGLRVGLDQHRENYHALADYLLHDDRPVEHLAYPDFQSSMPISLSLFDREARSPLGTESKSCNGPVEQPVHSPPPKIKIPSIIVEDLKLNTSLDCKRVSKTSGIQDLSRLIENFEDLQNSLLYSASDDEPDTPQQLEVHDRVSDNSHFSLVSFQSGSKEPIRLRQPLPAKPTEPATETRLESKSQFQMKPIPMMSATKQIIDFKPKVHGRSFINQTSLIHRGSFVKPPP